MRRHDMILLLLSLCATLVSCTEGDVMSEDTTVKQCDLLLNMGYQGGMRMAGDVVQADQSFRGLQNLMAIPFRTSGAVTVDDIPLLSEANTEFNLVNSDKYFYLMPCNLMRGTNRMLVYGKAAPVSGKESPEQNGQLVTTLTGRMPLADVTFSLQSIHNTTEVHADAQALADYLTAIAKTTGWSTTSDASLKALYLDFIHADGEGTGLMGGSAAHVKAYAKALKDQLDGTDLLSMAIKAKIDDNSSIENNDYPASLGLPDGAAALRWIDGEKEFSVRTMTTTLDNINGINRYTYPAELWYFVDSPILTSFEKVNPSDYEQDSWDAFLSNSYQGGNTVVSNTRSVAVQNPLQYGVARLQMTLANITGTLLDSKGNEVPYVSPNRFPLTAVIVGAQHTVGFDFKPMGEQSNVDARFVYDPVVGNTGTVNTLVLQTYDHEKVPVILEFENKTVSKFNGKDGIIYPNTKFYLIAELDPEGMGTGDYANRVFTADHTTVATMKVTSLANAYSCMPDLLSPRLEIGVQVVKQWVQSTTTTVKL